MPILKALIFDVDGTLANTERDGHRVAFNSAFAEAGLNWAWSVEQYGELLVTAGGKERLQAYIKQHQPDFVPLPNARTWAATMHQAKTQYYKTLIRQNRIGLRPGVKRLVQEARAQNLRLAIATTTTLENVVALLETALAPDSSTWFELIAAGDIVSTKKPAPDVYLYVLEHLGLPPQNCLAIEDSRQGLLAATGAGLKTVITHNDYTQTDDFTAACLVLNHLGEPDQPFQVVSGDAGAATYFDLSLARQLV